MSTLLLSPLQARVLAALVEKSLTTPQYYPLTRNALQAACNQKNCREPVMQLSEGEVGAALVDLEEMDLVAEEAGARSSKWRHRFTHQLLLQPPTQAVLVSLMLRGPQTLAELRSHATPLDGPQTVDGVQDALEDLADRAQPLVQLLPREPGRSQQRYAHCLCGEPAVPEPQVREASGGVEDGGQMARLEARLDALEAQVRDLLVRLNQ